MKTTPFVLAFLSYGADAFTAPKASVRTPSRNVAAMMSAEKDESKNLVNESSNNNQYDSPSSAAFLKDLAPKAALTTAAVWSATTEVASAAGPDWGIFEGRTGSLLHPVMMATMFLYSAYTAFLGFQWRRQRTLGDEISQLKKTLPDMGGASSVAEAIKVAQEAEDKAKVVALTAAKDTEAEIAALQQERKDLAAAGPRDKHFAQGALLAFIGTSFAIEVRVFFLLLSFFVWVDVMMHDMNFTMLVTHASGVLLVNNRALSTRTLVPVSSFPDPICTPVRRSWSPGPWRSVLSRPCKRGTIQPVRFTSPPIALVWPSLPGKYNRVFLFCSKSLKTRLGLKKRVWLENLS